MSQNNTEQAPRANLDQSSATRQQHPLNPNWTIGAALSEGWDLTKGFKATMWVAILIYMGIVVAASVVLELLTGDSLIFVILSQVILNAIVAPLMTGLYMLGIKRAAGQPVKATMVLDYFPKTLPLFLALLLMMVLVTIGFILLVIPGIYLTVAYILALPLLVDRNIGIWESLETSRKAITQCWFRFFGFFIVALIIVIVSAIPLGIGWIWTMPWLYAATGVIYRDIFGVSS